MNAGFVPFSSRRARIVCTLGPASRAPATVRALVDAGMDVARLNFSHGTHDDHAAACRAVRQAADAAGRAVAVLADLQGPKIRLGTFAGGGAVLENGAEFVITTEPLEGDARRASTTYEALARDVKPGDVVLVDDGLLRLEVLSTDGHAVRCRVLEGGPVSDHKGLNLPGVVVSAPPLTGKDVEDLRFALGLPVDFVALSFVRAPEHAEAVRGVMRDAGVIRPVVAKLEKPEAVERLDGILTAFDGLMVARGDLGVEMPLEAVPLVQKQAIRFARERGKPVIVATQMLESMVRHSRPTRAEASDVANAVLDGADALMLSAETGVGAFPVESVATMARLIGAAEQAGTSAFVAHPGTSEDALAAAAVEIGLAIGARALVACTQTGTTARRLARHRAPVPLIAFTPDPAVRRQLALVWGVEAFVVPQASQTDEMVAQVERALLALGRARLGETVVMLAGTPAGTPGATNTLRVHRLGGA